MSNAITYRMPQGIPGILTRQGFGMVEAQVLGATPVPAYGFPVKMSSGLILPLSLVGDTLPFGWLVRPWPTTDNSGNEALGTAVPPATAGSILNIMKRGYMSVFCQANAGSVAANGTVYLRYANASGAAVVGGVEATSIGATTVALTNCYWCGPADANGNAEIYFDAV